MTSIHVHGQTAPSEELWHRTAARHTSLPDRLPDDAAETSFATDTSWSNLAATTNGLWQDIATTEHESHLNDTTNFVNHNDALLQQWMLQQNGLQLRHSMDSGVAAYMRSFTEAPQQTLNETANSMKFDYAMQEQAYRHSLSSGHRSSTAISPLEMHPTTTTAAYFDPVSAPMTTFPTTAFENLSGNTYITTSAALPVTYVPVPTEMGVTSASELYHGASAYSSSCGILAPQDPSRNVQTNPLLSQFDLPTTTTQGLPAATTVGNEGGTVYESVFGAYAPQDTGARLRSLPRIAEFPVKEEDVSDLPCTSHVSSEIGSPSNKRVVYKPGKSVKTRSKQMKSTSKKGKTNPMSSTTVTTVALPQASEFTGASRQTSCWRCRRYKKPCNGKGSVCDACVTSGFRIWSSDIGCRKGDLSDFILMLIPSSVETKPITISTSYTKPPSFRRSAQIYPSDTMIPLSAAKGDAWDQFLYKVQSTGIHGPGVLELLQIVIRHQRKFKKPDKVIISAVRAMSVASDVFRQMVATYDGELMPSAVDFTKVFSEARKVLVAAAGHFLRNCLTGRIRHWFTTFMASIVNVFAYIMIGDAIFAIPDSYRFAVWPDVRKTLMDLRQVMYPTARDLLNALSKGSQPLNMSCWESKIEDAVPGRSPRWVRNAEGMRLVDDCEATFDGMRELQMWRERFSYLLRGDSWMSSQPLAVDLLLISSVSRLFITPPT